MDRILSNDTLVKVLVFMGDEQGLPRFSPSLVALSDRRNSGGLPLPASPIGPSAVDSTHLGKLGELHQELTMVPVDKAVFDVQSFH